MASYAKAVGGSVRGGGSACGHHHWIAGFPPPFWRFSALGLLVQVSRRWRTVGVGFVRFGTHELRRFIVSESYVQ